MKKGSVIFTICCISLFQTCTIIAFVIPKQTSLTVSTTTTTTTATPIASASASNSSINGNRRQAKKNNTRLYLQQSKGENDDMSMDTNKQQLQGKNLNPHITTIQGLDSFLEFLAESDDRIVIIEFYAAWCKSCHAFGMKYKQLARKHGDLIDNKNNNDIIKGKVRFAQVEYGANVRLCKTFGIKKLPYIHIYKAPLGKVADFVCGPKYFEERLVSRLEKYLMMSDEEIKFDSDMEYGESLMLGDEVLTELEGLSSSSSSSATKEDSNTTSIV